VRLTAELRRRIREDPEYQRWRDTLPTVVVDGERFTVIHGDRLANDDDLLQEWAGLFHPEWFGS
jgi:UDP-2,3-diacylglucosamine pyrophosphatase LpxH